MLAALVQIPLLFAMLPAEVAFAEQAPGTTQPIKRIVFLFSDEVTTAGNVRTDHGLRIGFARDQSFRMEFYQEYLDLTRFGGEAYEQRLAGVLSQKYGGRQPDLLITIAPPASLFAVKWGPIVFPGVPVVSVCPSRAAVSAVRPDLDMTAVLTPFDARGTVEAALRLRPHTHRVVIVSGAAVTDKEYLALVQPDLTGFEGRVSLEHLTGLPMNDLLDRAARLPRDTVILYLSIFRDGMGRDFEPRDALELVAAGSAVPVFGVAETHLGHGLVGGHLLDWEKAGVRAAELALQVLHGARPRTVAPSSEGFSSWIFDARQLKRWGIRESALPPGSVVRFRQPSLWREHPWGAVGTILFILAETALIVGLVLQMRGRRREYEQRRLLSAIVESSNDAVIGIDLEQRIVSWNLGAQKVFGYTPEEAVGQLAELLVPPQHLREAYSAFTRVMAGQTLAPFETVRLRKDGSLVDVSISDSPIRDARGKIIGISSAQRDIGEHRRMEQALRRSEERLSSVFAAMAEGVMLYGPDAKLITCNAAAERILGYSLEQIRNSTALAQEQRGVREDGTPFPAEETPAWVTLQTGRPCTDVVVGIRKPNRELTWISVNSQPLFKDGVGPPTAVVVTFSDITEQRRSEQETQRAQQELSHVARVTMMGELTSSLAHELNQPLTAILSNAQTAQRLLGGGNPDPEELREILSDIVADDERAGGIIGRLRALLKKGHLELQPVDLNVLVREVAGLVRSDTIIKNVSLTLDLEPELPPVRGDHVQLQQVILNLMINAIDAMKGAGRSDRKLVVHTESGERQVQVAVRDSGAGIPQDRLEGIFEAFYTTKAEGMGMGLAIARSIARAHGGKLWAENNLAGGATFTLALPTVQ